MVVLKKETPKAYQKIRLVVMQYDLACTVQLLEHRLLCSCTVVVVVKYSSSVDEVVLLQAHEVLLLFCK